MILREKPYILRLPVLQGLLQGLMGVQVLQGFMGPQGPTGIQGETRALQAV